MSGIGPVEPGEGTSAWDAPDPGASLLHGAPRGRLGRLYDRHRRVALTTAAIAALLAGGGYLYAARPRQPPPPPPPYPSQVVEVTYLNSVAAPSGAPPRSFSFGVVLRVESGPPVTVSRIAQPYAGLSVTSLPRPPFRTRAGSPRKVVITMHVTECGKVPEDAGLPFLDVTLRNTRAMQVQSFVLGPRYAHALSSAVRVACDDDSG
ncbi:Tat pathway signal sequence domain protein [Streptomyces sp. NPDC057746]|uniref:Tat pathway signal sequence domain protein n=1 Tax=Streptomyces sp. NPDC057746 TaxID=3346237 RepID=UPI0036B79D8F